ncbi:MAG: DUF5011 domain-containing protein, partial [Nitrosopumilus sp.]|nr:DUF5011 domain-containing protein [Nitrosopumilus sp.]
THTITVSITDSFGNTTTEDIIVTIVSTGTSADLSITKSGELITSGGTTGVIDVRVATGTDDAEEDDDEDVSLNSSDLDLNEEEYVGMRFNGIEIPNGATITNAYVQLTTEDDQDTGYAKVKIFAQDSDNAQTFTSQDENISSRPTTSASVSWVIPDWIGEGTAGAPQQTPDLTALIQEVVDRNGWISGNSIAIIVEEDSGSADRDAKSYENAPDMAPLLHIEYEIPSEQSIINYTLEIENNGPDTATNVLVIDNLPSEVTAQTVDPSECDLIGNTVTCDFSSLSAGSDETITITTLVNSGVSGVISNTATVSADESDPNPANNEATAEIIIDDENIPPTAIADATPNPADEGQTVTLDGTGSFDPDGEVVSYLWIQIAGPTVSLSDSTISEPTFTAPSVGSSGETLVFSLVVKDNENASSEVDTVSIQIKDVPSTDTVQAQKLAIIDELKDLKPLAESSKTVKDIDQAIKRVQKSLDAKYWQDENTLDPKQGHHSIHEEEKAVKKLMDITYKQDESESFLNSIQNIINHITLIDKTFAQIAIEEAQAANTDGQFTKQIEKAIEQFEKGLEDEDDGKFDKAIHHYEKAWVIISVINLLDDLDDYIIDYKDEDKEEKDDDKEDKVDEDKEEKDEDKEEKDDDKEDKVDDDKEDKVDEGKEEKDDDNNVNNAPVITLLGANPQIIQLDDSYLELNATATDIEDGDLTGSIVIDSTSVNTAVPGNYTVTYDVSDSLLLPAVQQMRTVEVVNGTIIDVNNAPVITLLGANPQIIQLDDSYLELNATATDIEDGDLTGSIVIDSTSVNTAVPGNYTVTYDVSDSSLLPAVQQMRTVEVVNGTIIDVNNAPVITLLGANPQIIQLDDSYLELNATATDIEDGDL